MIIDLTLVIEILIFIVMVIASLTDIKFKEIEDYFSYIIAIVSFILVIILKNSLIIASVYGLVLFGLGYILYVNGLWGGGDTKLLGALGIYFSNYGFLSIIVYFMSLALIGILYNNIISFYYLPKLIKKKEINVKYFFLFILLLLISIIYKQFIFSILILLVFDIYYFKIFEQKVMIVKKKVKDLTEGDWLIEKIKGIPLRKVGLIKEDLDKLKKMKIKEVKIKDGFAFIPVMTLALIAFYIALHYGYLDINKLNDLILMIIKWNLNYK